MNLVAITGRITANPNPQGEGNKKHLNFAVAVDEFFGGTKKTHFFNCVAFGGTADFIARHFVKGARIEISGKLANNNYESRETGKTVYSNEIIVEKAGFGGSAQQRDDTAHGAASERNAESVPASSTAPDMDSLQQQADFLADEDLPI